MSSVVNLFCRRRVELYFFLIRDDLKFRFVLAVVHFGRARVAAWTERRVMTCVRVGKP